MGKGQKKGARARRNSTQHTTPRKAIGLDDSTRELIVSESKFLGLDPEEYVKLVMICAQVLRESTVKTPLEDSALLRSLIGSPLLLTMARTFASNYLSNAISELIQSQRPEGQSQTLPPRFPVPHYTTPNPSYPSPGGYPEWYAPKPSPLVPRQLVPYENQPPRQFF